MNRRFLPGLLLVTALATVVAAEVQVNERSSGTQANPAVAAAGAGGAVIVWSSYYTTMGRSNDILARRLDSSGAFVGTEFPVNTESEGNQTEPAVASNRRGDFAVVWQGPGPEAEDIYLRRFDPNGSATTDDLLVNLDPAGRQLYPRVALSGTGALAVVWESRATTEDGDRFLVCAQLFDPNGSGRGGEIMVDDPTLDCRYPDVAMDGAGNFVVTWLRETGTDSIMARRFGPDGVPVTEPFAVSTARITSITRPSVAMNSLGYFAVAWDGDPNRAADDDVHLRCYDPNGTPQGEPVLVNTDRTGAQQWPQVALNDANELMVVWEHHTDDPDLKAEIFARLFQADGQPAGAASQLNTYTQDQQRYPDVAAGADGSFLAVWESNGQDGSGNGIFADVPAPDAGGAGN
jgi:hypothetical protein